MRKAFRRDWLWWGRTSNIVGIEIVCCNDDSSPRYVVDNLHGTAAAREGAAQAIKRPRENLRSMSSRTTWKSGTRSARCRQSDWRKKSGPRDTRAALHMVRRLVRGLRTPARAQEELT